jgi:hypothetical protein
MSTFTYNRIQELLDYKYKMINPVLSAFALEEKKFFLLGNELFKKFDNLPNRIQAMDRKCMPTISSYDPAKYVRGHKILSNNPNVNNQNIKLGGKIGKGQGGNENIQGGNNVQNPSGKFDYETYMKNKDNSSKTVNNNDMSSVNSSKSMDPGKFSYDNYVQQQNKQQTYTNNEFSQIDNSFSSDFTRKQNFPQGSSNRNEQFMNFQPSTDIKQTTILQNSQVTEQIHENTFNPYASLTFNDFKPMHNPGTTNRSQIPTQNTQQAMGSSTYNNNDWNNQAFSQMGQMGNNMNNNMNMGNFPNYQDLGKNQNVNNSNMKFPK